MRIGIPRETKEGERRVGLLPDHIAVLANEGCEIVVEAGAGTAVGVSDDDYRAAGARIGSADDAGEGDLAVKVKKVLDADLPHLARGSALFGFAQLPGEPQ